MNQRVSCIQRPLIRLWRSVRFSHAVLMSRCVAPAVLVVAGCSAHQPVAVRPKRPDVVPAARTFDGQALTLDASVVTPMYTELVPIDLPTVVRVASTNNLDILGARQDVRAARGRLESAVGSAFPAIVPTALFERIDGRNRNTDGRLLDIGFWSFSPAVALQWLINPGAVYYQIVAAKRRLAASEEQETAARNDTLRRAVNQFYDLVLAQSKLAAVQQSVHESEELVRITGVRVDTGTGVRADALRAEARLAARKQELVVALREFYDASVAIAVTLRLDATVTLVPKIEELPPVHLVHVDMPIEDLLGTAVSYRPDLARIRSLARAALADRGVSWWASFGPDLELSYQYGGITGHANNVVPADGIPNNLIHSPVSANGSFSSNPFVNGLIREGIGDAAARLDGVDDQTYAFSRRQQYRAGLAWRLSLAAFGDLKTSDARFKQQFLAALRRLDRVRAEVVSSAQASDANRQLIGLAMQQVDAAAEALRLSEANLRAGTMTTLDVLHAQDMASQARLRQAKAVVRYNQSQVDLLAAIGLIDAASLGCVEPDPGGNAKPQPGGDRPAAAVR